MNIDGSVAVVAGAASGLGRATVTALLAGGSRVAVLDAVHPVDDEGGESLADRVPFCRCDVTNSDDLTAGFDEIAAAFGRLDLCVNCAAIHIPGRLIPRDGGRLDLDGLRRSLEVNVVGLVDVMSRSAQLMLGNEPNDEGERGVIINVGSIVAIEGPIGSISYSASKGAVMAITLPVARELGRFGVRVVHIAPGTMQTPLLGGLDSSARTMLAESHAFPHRLGRPSEFSALVCTAIETVFLDAATIRIDGGARLGPYRPPRRDVTKEFMS